MRLLFSFLLLVGPLLATPAWVVQTTTNQPGHNEYGAATYNQWQQKMQNWWNTTANPNIYATSYQSFAYPTTWTKLNDNTDASSGCPVTLDTTTEPGSGHPGHSGAYDWRHTLFFVWQRLECGTVLNTLYSWVDNLSGAGNTGWNNTNYTIPAACASTTTGPWCQLLAQNAPSSGINQSIEDPWMFYDPLNNVLVEFAGLKSLSVSDDMRVYNYKTNTLTCFNDSGSGGCTAYPTPTTLPSARGATAGVFDYYYADHNAGEARYLFFGGYGSGTTCFNDVLAFYPNGSAANGYSANTWHAPSVTGTGPASGANWTGSGGANCYAWVADYDTLRDKLWVYQDSSHVAALDIATMAWTAYAVTDSSGDVCPRNDCNMVYDAAHDQLISTGATGGSTNQTITLDLQTVLPFSRSGGSYPTVATNVYIQRPIAYPAFNTSYVDPLGATVTRVTNATVGASAPANYPIPLYSQIKPTDSSERLMFNSAGQILDITNNYKDLGIALWSTFRSENAIWMRGTALTLDGLDVNNTNIFKKCLVVITGSGGSEAGTLSCTTMADMSATYQVCAGNGSPNEGRGSNMNQVSQQDRDRNDTYVVLTCQKNSVATIVMIVLNIQTGVTGAELVINPPTPIGGCSPGFGPNYAWVGYLANYVLVDWGLPVTGNGRYCGIESYNLASAANPAGSWTYVGTVIPDSTHGDLAVVGGVEYFVAFAAGSDWSPFTGTITRCVVPDGWSQASHAGCTAMLNTPNGGGHITAHAFNANPMFFIYDDDEDGGTVQNAWYAGHTEAMKVFWDSTAASPHMQHLLHTRSSGNWFVACNTCQASSYRAQAKTTLNMDGSKAWFASSWGPVDAVNTFQVTLPAPVSSGGSVKIGGVVGGNSVRQ